MLSQPLTKSACAAVQPLVVEAKEVTRRERRQARHASVRKKVGLDSAAGTRASAEGRSGHCAAALQAASKRRLARVVLPAWCYGNSFSGSPSASTVAHVQVKGLEERPRLSVFRSHLHIYAQVGL